MSKLIWIICIFFQMNIGVLKGETEAINNKEANVQKIKLNYKLINSNCNDVIWADSQFVVSADNFGAFLTSADGKNWKFHVSAITMMFEPAALIWFEDEFVSLGRNGLMRSSHGGKWSQFSASLPITHSKIRTPVGSAWSEQKGIFVESNSILLKSKRKRVWEKFELGFSFLCDVVWTGKRFYVVGGRGLILSSLDGISWEKHESGTNSDLYSIACNNQYLIAVGDNGTILVSFDGDKWKQATSGVENKLFGITISDKYCVAVGTEETILTSRNSKMWEVKRGRKFFTLNAIAWSEKGYVAIGDKGTILFSKDTEKWDYQNKKNQGMWLVVSDD